MNFRAFLSTVWLYRATFVIVLVAVLAAGVAAILMKPPTYVSTAQLLVSLEGSTTASSYQNAGVVEERVDSYITLLSSDVVSQRVVEKLGLPESARDLATRISAVNVPPKTSVIDVAVTDRSPDQARRLADTVATEFVAYVAALETPTGEDDQQVTASVVTEAGQPTAGNAERIVLGLLAAALALLLAAVAVWVRWATDRVIRTASRAAAAANLPVLGTITPNGIASAEDLEGYRRQRNRLRALASREGGRVVELVPAGATGEVTAIATNFGRAMQLGGSRSVVVTAIGNDENDGTAAPDPALHVTDATRTGYPDTVAAADWADRPERAATERAATLFGELRSRYDFVFVAVPPTSDSLTAAVVGENADAAVLLVRVGKTKRRALARTAAALREADAPLTGVLLVVASRAGKPSATSDALAEERQHDDVDDVKAEAASVSTAEPDRAEAGQPAVNRRED